MTDEQITKAAREICAEKDFKLGPRYLSGELDQSIWVRLVEQGIRRGLEIREKGT